MGFLNYFFFIFLISIFTNLSFLLAEQTYYTGLFSKTALKGYDVVTYFEAETPQKGSPKFVYSYNGINWRFISQKNLEAFKVEPTKFIPQYGGWCAYAMADGKKVGVDPKSFKIINEKLYLNYNRKIQGKWLKNQDVYISKADKFWEKI